MPVQLSHELTAVWVMTLQFFDCKEQIYNSAAEYFQQFCRKTSHGISEKARHSEFASNAP